jgi:diguanylate cyclase (GGDEF)-like protein
MQNLRRQLRQLRQLASLRKDRIRALGATLRACQKENTILQEKNTILELEIERLRIETYTDPMTGLYNRRGMRHVWAEVGSEVTAVAVIDSDHFKAVNDRYGHKTGDVVICYIGETIRGCGVIACRTGGDEFIGLLTGVDPEKEAERIRSAIDCPRSINGHDISLTVTIGLCLVEQGHSGPTDALITYLERADSALYQGKHNGRNTITITS